MSRGRPRTAIGTFGQLHVTDLGGPVPRVDPLSRPGRPAPQGHRDGHDPAGRRGAAEGTAAQPHGTGGLLSMSSAFADVAELWLADLEMRDLSENTKENYRPPRNSPRPPEKRRDERSVSARRLSLRHG
jgi:hypothetical protein